MASELDLASASLCLLPEVPGTIVRAVQRLLELSLVPERFPLGVDDEDLIEPAGEGIANAEELIGAASAGRIAAVAAVVGDAAGVQFA